MISRCSGVGAPKSLSSRSAYPSVRMTVLALRLPLDARLTRGDSLCYISNLPFLQGWGGFLLPFQMDCDKRLNPLFVGISHWRIWEPSPLRQSATHETPCQID